MPPENPKTHSADERSESGDQRQEKDLQTQSSDKNDGPAERVEVAAKGPRRIPIVPKNSLSGRAVSRIRGGVLRIDPSLATAAATRSGGRGHAAAGEGAEVPVLSGTPPPSRAASPPGESSHGSGQRSIRSRSAAPRHARERSRFGVAAFILLVILTACFAILLHQRSRGAEAVDPELAEAGEPTALLATDGMRELPKDYRQQALTLIASYGRARDVAEVLPLLRSGGGLPASLVRSWQPWQAEDDWNPVIDPKIEHRQLNGHQYLLVKGRKPCSAPFRSYLVVENEGLRIDWEATEAFSESEFARLEAGEGGGITRALLGRGRFFTSVFPETGFDCYRLLSPDGSRILWGYAKRGGSAQQQLAELPDGGERMRPVTLRLSRHSAGGLENQWLIEEMLHIEWSAPYAAGHAFD